MTKPETTNVIKFPNIRPDMSFKESILRVNAYAYYLGLFEREKALKKTDEFIQFWRPHYDKT